MRPFLFSVLAGWILVHQGDATGASINTIGYYGREARCNHVAESINAKKRGEAWCLPDDAELHYERGM